uniref:Uncharacterized protein n=1 Tax=Panagrolaimus superbus TaxID=310955 RepID=A0A914Y9I5_9BILA
MQGFNNRSLLKHAFESIENLSRVSSIQYDSDINGMGERVESKYSFSLKDITKKINHEGTCVSIAEMNYVLDQIQRELKEVDLEKNAFYTFTLASKDFYPHDFSYV